MKSDIEKSVYVTARFIENKKLHISANEFFNISRSIVCSIFSNCITYLIVVLQLEN